MLKDILLPMATYPYPTDEAALGSVVRFAAAVGASITALAAAEARSRRASDQLMGQIRRLCTMESVRLAERPTRCYWPLESDTVVALARLHDITVVPLDSLLTQKQQLAEAVLFGSGRPLLVVPENGAEIRFERVVVAWDFGRAAARAVFDALPILSRARAVDVVTFIGEKAIARGDAAARHACFARHGMTPEYRELTYPADDQPIGEVLQKVALDHSADMLVMGGYGHSRLREFVLGGATRTVLEGPLLPVFLSH